MEIPAASGKLVVWTSPYAPFFGARSCGSLRTLGALTGLALDRARLFAQERGCAAGARAGGRAQDELRRARRARAADAGGDDPRLVETLHARGDQLRRPAGAARARRCATRRRGCERSSSSCSTSRASRPTRSRSSRAAAGEARASRSSSVRGGRRADGRDRRRPTTRRDVHRPDRARPDRLEPRRERAPLRRAAVIVAPSRTTGTSGSPSRTAAGACRPSSCPTSSSASPAASARPERGTGTGLGLAIARSYAKAHRGDLVYERASPTGRASRW